MLMEMELLMPSTTVPRFQTAGRMTMMVMAREMPAIWTMMRMASPTSTNYSLELTR
jgi:hypothetical protein